MTITPIRILLAATVALPLVAAASLAQAAPVISDHNYSPSDVHKEKTVSPLLDAQASMDVFSVDAARCTYRGGPKLDVSLCR